MKKLLVVGILLVASVTYFQFKDRISIQIKPAESEVSRVGQPVDLNSAEIPQGSQNTKPRPAFDHASAEKMAQRFAEADDLSVLVDELIGLAESGDMNAKYYLARSYEECINKASTEQQDVIVETLRRSGASVELIERSHQQFDRCDLLIAENFGEEFDKWYALALEDEHPVILSESLPDVAGEKGFEQADAKAVEALASGHLQVLVNLGEYLAYRDFFSEKKSPPETSSDRQNALLVLACRLGYPQCQAGGEMILSVCGYESSGCSANQSFDRYLLENLGNPDDAQRVLALYRSLLALYENGDYAAMLGS